jgi:hypothetical protein
VVEGLAHPSLASRQVPVGGASEVPVAALRRGEPESDGLAAVCEKDDEGGDGEEVRDGGAGPHRREFHSSCCCVRQRKWMRAPASKRRKCVERRTYFCVRFRNRVVRNVDEDSVGPSLLLG